MQKNSLLYPELLGIPLFEDLPAETAQDFIDSCIRTVYDEPTELLHQGMQCPGVYIIAQGSVEVSIVDSEGHHAVLVNIGAGDIFGEIETVADSPCIASCKIAAGGIMLFRPGSHVLSMLSNPIFVRNVFRINYHRLLVANRFHSSNQFHPVDVRICLTLENLARNSNVIRQSQAYVADMVGCSRQTINRVLGELRDENILALRKGVIEIIDRERLVAKSR